MGSFMTEMDSTLVLTGTDITPFCFVKINFRTLYDVGITQMFNCRSKSFEYLNSPKFQFVKSRKLSDFCSKIYEKSLN